MAHELRATIRLTASIDDLDIARIANLNDQFEALKAAVMAASQEGDIYVEIEPPKLVGVRAKEPPLDIPPKPVSR